MSSRPIAVVTGASAGIGLAYAEALARSGHDLVLVARRKDRLEETAQRLASQTGAHSEVLVADLATDSGVAALEARLARGDSALVVNNAGFSGYRPFAELPVETLEQLLRIHVTAVTRATRAALPGMVAARSGGIINVASLLALSGTLPSIPLPFRAVYAGAKAYLLTFTQLVASEVAGSGVRVQVCLPGVVDSEFHLQLPEAVRARLKTMAMPPADVVRASLAGLERGEAVVIPGLADAARFDAIGTAERAVFEVANGSPLAGRYA